QLPARRFRPAAHPRISAEILGIRLFFEGGELPPRRIRFGRATLDIDMCWRAATRVLPYFVGIVAGATEYGGNDGRGMDAAGTDSGNPAAGNSNTGSSNAGNSVAANPAGRARSAGSPAAGRRSAGEPIGGDCRRNPGGGPSGGRGGDHRDLDAGAYRGADPVMGRGRDDRRDRPAHRRYQKR